MPAQIVARHGLGRREEHVRERDVLGVQRAARVAGLGAEALARELPERRRGAGRGGRELARGVGVVGDDDGRDLRA